MNNLKLWLKALKSGKYKVSTNQGFLKSDDGSFSVAGLAADMYIRATKKSSWDGNQFTETGNDKDFPITVLEWLGIKNLLHTDVGSDANFMYLRNIKKPVKEVVKLIEEVLRKEKIL